MAKSTLATVILPSPHYSSRCGRRIDRITIHHAAGIASARTLGLLFQNPARGGSANYGIGNDGEIGCYVDEKYRAWTSGSDENDRRAVTIEVSNCKAGGDWPVSDRAYDALIRLCADICRRNGIGALRFTGDKTGNLTMHRYFQPTACPGEYLARRFGAIADAVNAKLRGEEPMTAEEKRAFETLEKQAGATVDTVEQAPAWAKETLKKLTTRGILQGDGTSLRLSEQMVRMLVILDRAGIFGG